MSPPFTEESIKNEMRKLVCRGFEGHAPTAKFEYWGSCNSTGNKFYTPFLCSKCGTLVYVDEDKLTRRPSSRPTPSWP